MPRDDFPKPITEALAKRVALRCSNPDCSRPTSGPHTDPDKAIDLGVAAHITAASPGGPRYDAELNPQRRASLDNAIFLCQHCVSLIDNEPGRYPVELLRAWKATAEQAALTELTEKTTTHQPTLEHDSRTQATPPTASAQSSAFAALGWKEFERLAADLLTAEDFHVISEPSVDRSGTDLLVVETYRSHDPSRTISIRWRVQCKQYAGSNRAFGRREVEESIYHYESLRQADEGLFLITTTDFSEEALATVNAYIATHPHARITLWNRRQLLARLQRHPHLLRQYALPQPTRTSTEIFRSLSGCSSLLRVLKSLQTAANSTEGW